MRWNSFIFWFCYRLVMASLAHFNWAISIYINCAYFTLWKSYDLCWFWMHLVLCVCYPTLRKQNYLLVWTNLIWKKYHRHPEKKYKDIYIMYYRTKGTKATRELQRIETEERIEGEREEIASEISENTLDQRLDKRDLIIYPQGLSDSNGQPQHQPDQPPASLSSPSNASPPMAFAPHDRRSNCSQPSSSVVFEDGKSLSGQISIEEPSVPRRPPRKNDNRPAVNVIVKEPNLIEDVSSFESDTNSTSRWLDRIPMPKALAKRFQHHNREGDSASNVDLPRTPEPSLNAAAGISTTGEDTESLRWSDRLNPRLIAKRLYHHSKSDPPEEEQLTADGLERLYPNFKNRYDTTPKIRAKLDKQERKQLRKKIQKRRKMELKAIAKEEARVKAHADAIELLLGMLRMVTYFAMLTGNIRKTFIPAHFTYLRPGTHSYDSPELLMVMRCTVFLDVLLFWFNALYAFCLQCQLCCKLGLLRFWAWTLLLGAIVALTMFVPMSYVQEQLDTSWCRFKPNSTLAPFQPNW